MTSTLIGSLICAAGKRWRCTRLIPRRDGRRFLEDSTAQTTRSIVRCVPWPRPWTFWAWLHLPRALLAQAGPLVVHPLLAVLAQAQDQDQGPEDLLPNDPLQSPGMRMINLLHHQAHRLAG